MKPAIEILQNRLRDMDAAQASEEVTAYCNILKLAISVLQKYDSKLNEIVQRELTTP